MDQISLCPLCIRHGYTHMHTNVFTYRHKHSQIHTNTHLLPQTITGIHTHNFPSRTCKYTTVTPGEGSISVSWWIHKYLWGVFLLRNVGISIHRQTVSCTFKSNSTFDLCPTVNWLIYERENGENDASLSPNFGLLDQVFSIIFHKAW